MESFFHPLLVEGASLQKSYPLLLSGIVLSLLLGACTSAAHTETETQLPQIYKSPRTDPPLTPTTTLLTAPHVASPTLESATPPPSLGGSFVVCLDTNGKSRASGVPSIPAEGAGISVEQDHFIPPVPPGRVEAQIVADGVQLFWQGTGTDVDQFYQIYRKEVEDDCWELIGLEPVVGDNQGTYTFSIPDSDQPGTFSYAVTTLDVYGNESNIATTVKVNTDS